MLHRQALSHRVVRGDVIRSNELADAGEAQFCAIVLSTH